MASYKPEKSNHLSKQEGIHWYAVLLWYISSLCLEYPFFLLLPPIPCSLTCKSFCSL